MGNYSAYRKRSSRLINWWLLDKPEKTLKEFWYIYLLLEKATVGLRADPLTVLHELYENNIFTIEDVEKLITDDEKLIKITTTFGCLIKDKSRHAQYRHPDHIKAIKKAVEIHRNLNESNKMLLKDLGYS